MIVVLNKHQSGLALHKRQSGLSQTQATPKGGALYKYPTNCSLLLTSPYTWHIHSLTSTNFLHLLG